MTDIQKRLFDLQDEGYRAGSIKLNPTVDPDTIIGIRIPAMRALAKELKATKESARFINELPHAFFEEYQLHAFIIGYIKDFGEGLTAVQRLLPYLNSWAQTDSLRIKAFDRDPERLMPYIYEWLGSKHPYTVRYSILCLMNYFLDDSFDEKYLAAVSEVKSEEYYVNMMIAWYFATALAKQYDSAIKYIEDKKLSKWVHNKTIQKAIESYRVSDEHKAYLRTLKIK